MIHPELAEKENGITRLAFGVEPYYNLSLYL